MADVDVVTVSSKGQIVLPKRARDAMGIEEGSRLLVVQDKEVITIKKMNTNIARDMSGYVLSEKSLAKVWSSKEEDEAWKDL
ncbi:MAG: AbrB/MazE/SpoVT family DNA-binding domain-containing protein [archaeon]